MILLPAAEPALAAARRIDPALVRPGLPAHVTALYPFLPDDSVSSSVLDAVRSLASAVAPTEVRLDEFLSAPGFAALPAPSLQPITDAVCDRWPEVAPYGGRFGPRPPAHVTVAMGGDEETLSRVGDEVRPLLPLTDRATALQLVALTEHGWKLRLDAPFAG